MTTEYSSGTVVTRTFNNLGLIKTLVDNANRTTTWHYDKAGRARALTLPNGQTQENTYDLKGQLTDRVLKNTAAVVLADFGWTHDAVGNVLTQSETWPTTAARAAGTRTTTMTYHDAGWLDTETIAAPREPLRLTEYHYDDAANREFKIVSENGVVTTSTAYDYNPANQLESWTESNGAGGTLRSAIIGFDERGNRDTQTVTLPGGVEKTTQYDWNFQNRLVSVTDPQGGAHAYAYDYRSRRIARSEPGGATAVSWSGGLSLAEYPVSRLQSAIANPQSPIVEYRRGPDMGGGIGGLLHSLRNGAPKYNLGNGRGDVVAQSDATGALTWTASYEAFGTRPVETGSNADRQRANTKEEDPTGLLWEHFRYRDLETGVWLSRDPAGFVDGPNLYAYVRQNPWTSFDPLGLEGVTAIKPEVRRPVHHRPPSGSSAVRATAGRAAVSNPAAAAATGFVATGVAGSMAGTAAVSQHFHARDLRQQASQPQPAAYGNSTANSPQPAPQLVNAPPQAPPQPDGETANSISVGFSNGHVGVTVNKSGAGSQFSHLVIDDNAPDGHPSPPTVVTSETGGWVPNQTLTRDNVSDAEINRAWIKQGGQLANSALTGSAGTYKLGTNDCVTHVQGIVNAGGGSTGTVKTPHTEGQSNSSYVKELKRELQKKGYK